MRNRLVNMRKNSQGENLIKYGYKVLKRRFTKWILHTDLFYVFSKPRRKTKAYISDIPPINRNHLQAANYFIDTRMPLNDKSVVYSLGISVDSSFDEFLTKNYGCEVYMYDPTPASIEYMAKQKNELFKFFPIAVWIENTTLKFSTPSFGGSSSSFIETNDFFYAEARTISKLMEDNGHSHIDLFKADIEGAALPILLQMIELDIIPRQLIVEFERYETEDSKIDEFFKKITFVRNILREKGYEEFLLPREKQKYFSLEMLFIKI
ncbi:FkbM family methyltransferase [Aureispira sp. CCB-E]|uniref:FkbM family methyltransferase n=1 Tax=Aureispira sp. CCB-E TaxID=3051121 RepID=UPI00286841F5|nr:FkbM family methyltransferase [Aureispira sp. CCB-E]WMX16011.1 FkbM family methyltransferase [Aureispira sp. CCB-E]